VQGGLRAIFETMAQLARTVAPLLIDVLKIIGPIFEELGPPIQTLIKALGDALAPVIKALGPVLKAAAKAVGKLIEAFAPLLPVIGQLVAALLPALTPLFDALAVVFEALAPVIKTIADILVRTFTPILAALTPIIEPLAKLLADQLVFWLGFLGDLLIELAPSFEKIGLAFADLMLACAPLIEELARLGIQLLEKIAPYLPEIIDLVGKLAGFLAWVLASNISNILIPALEIVADLLSGDFSGALDKAKKLAIDMVSGVVRNFKEMPGKVWSALSDFGSKLKTRATEAGLALTRTVTQKIGEAVDWIKGLPGRAVSALGDISYTLFLAGWNLVGGFIEGILARVPNLKDNLNWITSMLTSWKGPESVDAKILTPAGEQVMGGFMRGISSQIPALRSQLQGLTGELPGMAIAGAGVAAGGRGAPVVRIELAGPDEVKRLLRKIVLDDGGGNVQRALGW
jgi:phage-related protein